jgi:hypothetical protein
MAVWWLNSDLLKVALIRCPSISACPDKSFDKRLTASHCSRHQYSTKRISDLSVDMSLGSARVCAPHEKAQHRSKAALRCLRLRMRVWIARPHKAYRACVGAEICCLLCLGESWIPCLFNHNRLLSWGSCAEYNLQGGAKLAFCGISVCEMKRIPNGNAN